MQNKQNNTDRRTIIQEITRLLIEDHKALEEKMRDLSKKEEPDYQGSTEDPDVAVNAVAEADVQKTIDTKLETQLRDIKKALDRIEAGLYGVCKYCDKEIETARLLARPTSNSCIECKKTLTQEE